MYVGCSDPTCTLYHYHLQNDDINTQIASLSTEKLYEFLREYFDKGKSDELESIDSENLLQSDNFGQTLLHWAATKGDLEVAKFIIKKTGVELFFAKTTWDEYTPLHLAVHGRNNDVLELLVDESTRNNLHDFVDIVDAHGQTALLLASKFGNLYGCQKLYHLMSDQAIHYQEKDVLNTPLHWAVQKEYFKIAQLLLSKDTPASELLMKVDKFGQSVLHWAASRPSKKGTKFVNLFIEKAFKLLPEKGRNFFMIKKINEHTALHLGVDSGNNESVDSLVKATRNYIPEFISSSDQYSQTALHWAASVGNVVACKCLCQEMKPSEINLQTKNRSQSALHFAVQSGHIETVKLLIQFGADMSLKDVYGLTALNWANKCPPSDENQSIIKLLETFEQ